MLPVDELPDARGFVLPAHRVLWVSVGKNACTSIKWMLATLSGQDPDVFHRHNIMRPDVSQTIHRRELWRGVPRYATLSPAERAEIHPDNGWFVFGVVRDPRVRLFSAFCSKLLGHHPRYLDHRDEAFFPALPRSAEDVRTSFARFVRFLHEQPEHPIAARDVHFRPQADLLATGAVPYGRIYDVRELTTMVADLTAHLAGLGRDEVPFLPRENGTPLRAYRRFFEGGTRELIDRRYARDLAEFGHHWDFDAIPDEDPNWPPAVFDSIAATAAAYDQIARLSRARRKGPMAQAGP